MSISDRARDFSGCAVLVVGMGTSGLAAARLLARTGARVRLCDLRTREQLAAAVVAAEESGVEVSLGNNDFWPGADLVVASPGVPKDVPALRDARGAGTPILGEMEIGARFCGAPIDAITGTNGKSTVVTMVDHILTDAGIPHLTGGNLDIPLCTLVADPVMDRAQGVVLEVSSYQLEDIEVFHPRTAAILNVAPDHIKRYRGHDHYAATKWNITRNQIAGDRLVLPVDYPAEHEGSTRAQVARFGETGSTGGDGVYLSGGRVRWAFGDERDEASATDWADRPRHWRWNALAALAFVQRWGVSLRRGMEALETYRTLPHRLEVCGERRGVVYMNDSKATNIHATVAAIRSVNRPLRLLCGGQEKGEDFARLAEGLEPHVRAVYCFGHAAALIAEALNGRVPCEVFETMEAAAEQASREARSGETVLLSPACASFDAFNNFEERGDAFRKWAREVCR